MTNMVKDIKKQETRKVKMQQTQGERILYPSRTLPPFWHDAVNGAFNHNGVHFGKSYYTILHAFWKLFIKVLKYNCMFVYNLQGKINTCISLIKIKIYFIMSQICFLENIRDIGLNSPYFPPLYPQSQKWIILYLFIT